MIVAPSAMLSSCLLQTLLMYNHWRFRSEGFPIYIYYYDLLIIWNVYRVFKEISDAAVANVRVRVSI